MTEWKNGIDGMDNLNENQLHSGKLVETYSPVDVREATGTLFLGILAVILLILYVQSNKRCQKAAERMMEIEK
ncbi:MAG: hypothetical protein ACM3PY_15735 [Omnitrophica WOR_2 bacterium]